MHDSSYQVTKLNPKVSIISIALSANEFEAMQKGLAQQTFQDFEFIGEVGGTIPEAWNRAIKRAKGEILVFTETDATPVNECWLAELVSSIPDENTIVKGLEITGSPFDMSNLAAYRGVFANTHFDETFRWAEDTEFFCKLKHKGYHLVQINKAPVIHLRSLRSKRLIRRAFRYGMYQARLNYRFSDPIEIAGVMQAGKVLIGALLNLLGLLIGYVVYFPERSPRKSS